MMQSSSAVPPPVAKSDIAYAGFWRRLLAYLIDGTLLAGLDLALYSTVHVLAPDNLDAVANVVPVAIAIGWAYFAVLESSPARGTLGKIALGLYVADVQGDPISFGRAVFRNAMKSVSWLVFGIGWVLAAFTPRKQALHDLLAGTLVLRRVHYFVFGQESPTEPGDHWDGSHWVASVPPLEKS
ncbi:MAG: RDD family protein [Chloroflexi bacterium]|nr:MAG: RDD family protein [Chloroflexota bacterium]